MKSKIINLGLLAGTFALAFNAYGAGDDTDQGGKTQVQLADLITKCEAIMKNDQMVKPTVDVFCDKHMYVWRTCPSDFTVTDSATVNVSVGMKSWETSVPFDSSADKVQACAVLSKHHLYVPKLNEKLDCNYLMANLTPPEDLEK